MTLHSAFCPHVPGQGSTHLLLKQDLSTVQSVFITHSGRQPRYGSPWKSSIQVHEPAPFRSRQIALGPQGDGLQGCRGTSFGTEIHFIENMLNTVQH